MKKRKDNRVMRLLVLLMAIAGSVGYANAQLPKLYPEVSGELIRMGMEDVAIRENGRIVRIAYDDPVYRGTCRGVFEVIRLVLAQPNVNSPVHLILLDEQVPQVSVQLPLEAIREYRDGRYTLEEVMRSLAISYDTENDMFWLKGVKRLNRSFGKVDVVLYPQVSLRNAWMDKLYGTVLNLAPAVEVGLWPGASLTGQVIFPIWNNMKGQMDYIRPGMLTFRQQYRFPENIFASFSIGNFNDDRMGADLNVLYRPDNGRWMAGVNAGLTGSSTFYSGKWQVAEWKRLTGAAYVQYNIPRYNLQLDLAARRFVFGDYGVRVDCSRHFGEVTVGVYAMYSGDEANGGFNFAIPLPRKKRYRRQAVRVRLPEYFDWEYEAQTGNTYAVKRLGRTYETRPDDNRSGFYYNPEYMKEYLINMCNSQK